MEKYKKRPLVIEALQLDCVMTLDLPEGVMTGKPGDWLIKGVKKELYFCSDAVFKMTYEKVEEE